MKRIISSVLCALLLIVAGLCVWLAPPESGGQQAAYRGILRLWHIDAFEGGRGSRSAFLSRVAAAFERENEGVYVMVRTLTAEGAAAAIGAGDAPDLLSFSCGTDGAAELAREMKEAFGGGEIGGKFYAYPWCCGRYYLFSAEVDPGDDLSAVSAEELVLSDGGNNLPGVAAALSGITGAAACEDSTSAYVHFLGGKYRYMLGTQRDVCRFQTRGANVYARPLTAYNDLYQYIAVTAREEERAAAAAAFVETLLGEEWQGQLSSLGMYPLSDAGAAYTLSAFVSAEGLAAAEAAGEQALRTGEIKILKTYLKELN